MSGKALLGARRALAFSSCSHRRRCDATVATEARVAVGVIQRIYLQRGLAPGRSSRRALSVVALAAMRQNR